MTTSDWITLIAAIIVVIGTFALAFTAFISIRQTSNIQRKSNKHRLLNEIIQWAVDISTCSFRQDEPALANVVKVDPLLVNLATLMDGYNSVRVRGEYIRSIASVFGTALADSVQEVITKLDEHLEIIRKYFQAEEGVKLEDSAKDLPEHRWFLIQSVNNLIEEASKIKTRDIG